MDVQIKRYAGSGGVTLAADVGGPLGGPMVVLLHGGGQTRFSWRKATRELIRMGYRVTSVDLRGHGDSDWAPNGDYRLEAFADDLRTIIATLNAPPAVVGASLGGLAALLAIGESSDLLASALVLVDVAPRVEEAGKKQIFDFMVASPNGFATIEEAANAVAAYLPHRARPLGSEGLKKNLRLGKDGRFRWHWDPAFLRGDRGVSSFVGEDRLRAAARHVRVPTLLVRGKLSEVVSSAGAQDLLDLIPGAQLVDIEGAGHMVVGDANDIFDAAIERFLRQTIHQ